MRKRVFEWSYCYMCPRDALTVPTFPTLRYTFLVTKSCTQSTFSSLPIHVAVGNWSAPLTNYTAGCSSLMHIKGGQCSTLERVRFSVNAADILGGAFGFAVYVAGGLEFRQAVLAPKHSMHCWPGKGSTVAMKRTLGLFFLFFFDNCYKKIPH